MALTIIKQPHILKPAMVRNPIEIGMETDNYLIAVQGQLSIMVVIFEELSDMEAGESFTVNCNGTIHTITIVAAIVTENDILPRSAFATDYLFGTHIRDRINAHSVIGPVFQGGLIYAGLTPDITDITFTSVNNAPDTLVFTKIGGGAGYTITNNVVQVGAFDEYDNRPTVLTVLIAIAAEGDPANNNTVTVELENITYVFTFKTTPDESGYQLPLRGADTLSVYTAKLVTALNGAPCLLDKWIVTGTVISGDIELVFTSVNFVAGEILSSFPSARYVFTNEPGYSALYQQNFTNNLRLLCEINYHADDFEKLIDLYSFPINEPDGDESHFISRFKIDRILYDFMAKTYKENLAAALPYVANAPVANHLLKKFYFRYYESYGSPSTAKLIKESAKYFAALYGAGHIAFVSRKAVANFGLLHPSGTADNSINLKQYVDKDQPAWLYFFIQPSDDNDIGEVTAIKMKIYYTDGTSAESEIETAAAFAVAIDDTQAFFVKAGYNQRNVGAGDTPTAKAYMWDIIIEIDSDDYHLIKRFVLDCCSSYKTFLCYQNSYGGIDTVAITAPKEFSLDITEGKEVERIMDDEYLKHDSQFESTVPQVRQSIKANIGFKKVTDYDVLKDLLTSKHVFVMPTGTTDVFIPVNIDRKSVQLESEDEYERNFSFEFAPAHEFKNFENNLWLK